MPSLISLDDDFWDVDGTMGCRFLDEMVHIVAYCCIKGPCSNSS